MNYLIWWKNMSSGGISENSQKIGFFCSMGKKENVKVVIFKNIQIYKNCHFPNLIFSRCTPLLLILMWCHFGINIIELVFLQMLHPLGANCALLLLPCYHMTSCCCYWIQAGLSVVTSPYPVLKISMYVCTTFSKLVHVKYLVKY